MTHHNHDRDRRIDCKDLAGRRGELAVLNDHGRVVLVTAAGETIVLTPHQGGQLRAVLRDVLLTVTSDQARIDKPTFWSSLKSR